MSAFSPSASATPPGGKGEGGFRGSVSGEEDSNPAAERPEERRVAHGSSSSPRAPEVGFNGAVAASMLRAWAAADASRVAEAGDSTLCESPREAVGLAGAVTLWRPLETRHKTKSMKLSRARRARVHARCVTTQGAGRRAKGAGAAAFYTHSSLSAPRRAPPLSCPALAPAPPSGHHARDALKRHFCRVGRGAP